MRFYFSDDRLRALYEGIKTSGKFHPHVVRAFRKKVGLVAAVGNENDLRAMHSLHFEKLKGDRAGQCSIRLNKQWRLIFRIENTPDGNQIVIDEIDDYH